MGNESGFFKAPNDLFEIGLNIYQIGVYSYLVRCSNNNKSAFPSYTTIASKCGISKRKAISTVSELEEMGLLKKRQRAGEGRNQSNTYRVVNAKKGAHHAPGVVHDMHHDGAQDAPYKELQEKELIEEELYYIALESDDHFINIYLNHLSQKKKKHPRVTEEQREWIINQIEHLREYEVTAADWEEQVKDHFEHLPKNNNGNIIAFLHASHRRFDIGMYDQF